MTNNEQEQTENKKITKQDINSNESYQLFFISKLVTNGNGECCEPTIKGKESNKVKDIHVV